MPGQFFFSNWLRIHITFFKVSPQPVGDKGGSGECPLSPAKKGGLRGLPPSPYEDIMCLPHKKMKNLSFLLKKGGSGGAPPRCFDRKLGAERALCPYLSIPLY